MKEISLYNGEVSLRFREEDHTYWAKTKDMEDYLPVPGVTSILNIKAKLALVPWAAKTCGDWLEENWRRVRAVASENAQDEQEMIKELSKEMKAAHRKLTQKAADSGTLAHDWIEKFIKGSDVPLPEDESAKKAIDAFMKWWEAHRVTVFASEEIIFSKENWYAGTLDLLAEIDGVLTLADFKTSSNIYGDMALQLGAYRLALGEMGLNVPQKKIIINIQKNGNLQTAEFPHHAADESGFLAFLAGHRWNRDAPKPRIERI